MSEASLDTGATGAPADAGAAPAGDQASTTLAGGAGGQDAGAGAAQAAAGDNWRQEFAGEDKAFLKTLDRFSTKGDFAKSYRELQAKVSQGVKPATLPDNPTPEQVAAWRKDNGIPETAAGYDVALGQGHVWADADKPLLDSFTAAAHEANLKPGEVKAVLGWYDQMQRGQAAQMAEADSSFRAQAEDALRKEMGGDFRANMNGISNMLNSMLDAETQNHLLTARLANGRMLGDDPRFVKMFAQLARETNPAATVVPAGTNNAPQAIADEIAELEKKMRSDRAAWFKDTASQERYRELLDAQEKMKDRAA